MAWLIVLLAFQDPVAASQGGTLHCYDMFTQIGTVAVREYLDAAGQVEKEIFYDSPAWEGPHDCTPHRLRVQLIRTYLRDSAGRPIVETRYGRDGRLEATSTIAYHGSGLSPYTRTTFGPGGELRSQTRDDHTGHVNLHFDADGRVAAVRGRLPPNVEYSIVWGLAVDGWSCGLGLPASRVAAGNGRVVLHLRNHTGRDQRAYFTMTFETELRDTAGRLMALSANYRAQERDHWTDRTVIYVESGGAAFFYGVDLDLRYGKLAPGRYTLTARHPHPETAAMLVCNTLTIQAP